MIDPAIDAACRALLPNMLKQDIQITDDHRYLVRQAIAAWCQAEADKFSYGAHAYTIVRDWLAHTARELRVGGLS